MNPFSHQFRITRFRFFGPVMLAAALMACAVILGMYSRHWTSPPTNKWAAAVILAFVGVLACLPFVGNITELVYTISIFALLNRFDVFLYRRETPYIQMHGFPLSLFDILFIYLFLEWALRIIKREATVRFYPDISVPAVVAIIFAAMAVPGSTYPDLSMCGLLVFLKCYLAFLYYSNNFHEKRIKPIILMVVASIAIQGFVGALQYVSNSTLGLDMFGESNKSFRFQPTGSFILSRVGGTLGSANGLAMFLNLLIPVLFCVLFMRIGLVYKALAVIGILVGGMTELLTLSRGGWVALAASISVAGLIVSKHKFRSYIKAASVVAVVVAAVCLAVLAASSDVRKRLFEDNYRGPETRIYLLQTAANVIKDNPVVGVGLNSYTTVMKKYDRTPSSFSYTFPFPVHNAFFLLAAECGLFSLLAILVMLVNIYRRSRVFFREDDRLTSLLGIGFTCGTLAWLMQSQFEPFAITSTIYVWFHFAMIVRLGETLRAMKGEPE